jgi:8-oxo-dGTP pyrophosphatase MutT (NUDIX family)
LITWAAIALALLILVIVAVAAWAYQTATRLDRLHVRYDLSWQALDAALARRAVVARAVAAHAYGDDPVARRIVALADAAERAPRAARENAENELSAGLALVDATALRPALIAELADAEARVLLGRRFHNDAVRDTLALRERRPVRWLRLGGTAPLPSYFEIAERAESAPVNDSAIVDVRTSARIVLLDEDGYVLLFCGSDPAVIDGSAPRWWFTVGGQAQPDETLAEAAARELFEETGLRADPDSMIGPVWRRDAIIDFNNSVIRSHELFFVYQTHRFEPSTAGHTPLEHHYIHGHRWCDAADIAALVATGEAVYPLQLGELLAEANALADAAGEVNAAAEGHEPQPIR